MSRLRSLGFVLLGRIVQAVVALASLRVLTSTLPPEEVGRYYVYVAFSSVFSLFLLAPLGMWGNRHIHQWARAEALGTVFRFYTLGCILSAMIAIPVVSLISFCIANTEGVALPVLIAAVTLSLIVVSLSQAFVGFLNLIGGRGEYVSVQIFTQCLVLILSWLLCQRWMPSGFGWLLGIVGGNLCALVLALWVLRRHFPSSVRGSWRDLIPKKSFLQFAAPMVLLGAVLWSQSQMFRILVESFSGAEVVAVLGVSLGVATGLAGSLEAVVLQLFAPAYYSSMNEEDLSARAKGWEEYSRRSNEIYFLGCFYVVVFARPLMTLLVSERYWGFHRLLIFGAVIEYFRLTVGVRQLLCHSEYQMKRLVKPALIVVFATFALLMALGRWGPADSGDSVAMVLCLTGALHFLLVQRATRGILPVHGRLFRMEWIPVVVGGLAVKAAFLADVSPRQALWILPLGLVPFLFVMRRSLRELGGPSPTENA